MGLSKDEILENGTWVTASTQFVQWDKDYSHAGKLMFGRVMFHQVFDNGIVYMVNFMLPPKVYPGEWEFIRTPADHSRLTVIEPTEKRELRWALMIMKS